MNYDVVIVGAGPVGVTAANLLGKAGVRVLIVILIVVMVLLQAKLWLGEGGYRDIRSLEDRVENQQQQNEEQEQQQQQQEAAGAAAAATAAAA